jgi:hypothetical protein
MNPVDGNVKGDCTSRGCEGSGTATTSKGPLYGKGNNTEVDVEVADTDEALHTIKSNTTNIKLKISNNKLRQFVIP